MYLRVCVFKCAEKYLHFFYLLAVVVIFSFMGCDRTNTRRDIAASIDSNESISSEKRASAQHGLPQPVLDFLRSRFADAWVADPSDYNEAWWSFYGREQLPYFVSVDLNDDEVLDYGLIIKQSGFIRVLILLDSANTYKSWMAEDFQANFREKDIQFGLAIEPPKRIDVVGSNQSLTLRSNAIALMNFENRSRIYYWESGKMKVFATADNQE
jgi:hypothetical protein